MKAKNRFTTIPAAEAVPEWIKRHGIGYGAEFVPFSKSRNAKPNATIRDMQINWRLTFTKGGRAFSCDYSQGIGHLPMSVKQPYKGADASLSRITLAHEPIILAALERGIVTRPGDFSFVAGKLAPPTARDVLESLALDAGVEDCARFEEWADEYGYDKDSRSAEAIYQACRQLADDMRVTLGREALAELRAMEWDT